KESVSSPMSIVDRSTSCNAVSRSLGALARCVREQADTKSTRVATAATQPRQRGLPATWLRVMAACDTMHRTRQWSTILELVLRHQRVVATTTMFRSALGA